MSENIKMYHKLLAALSAQRIAAGGELSQEVESPLIAALDGVWQNMSYDEQEEAERLARTRSVVGPSELGLVDTPVGGFVRRPE